MSTILEYFHSAVHWLFLLGLVFATLLVVLLSVAYYFSTPEGNAFIVTIFIRLVGGRVVKEFRCKRLNIFPFYVEDFSCTLLATKTVPEAVMRFKRFQANIDYSILLNPYFYFSSHLFHAASAPSLANPHSDAGVSGHEGYQTLALIQVTFEQLYASSPSVQFKDFLGTSSLKANDSLYHRRLDPKKYVPVASSSPMILAIKKAVATMMKFVDIRFNNFVFDFIMPVNECEIHGKCSRMVLQFKDSKTLGLLGMKVWNTILEGQVTIIDEGNKAFEYRGEKAKFAVDYYLPNGMMDVMVMLVGQRDYAWVNLFPFVQFYIKYQRAEDDLLEAKMACGRSTASKMNMCAEVEFIKVEVVDHRMPLYPPLTVLLRLGHFEMVSFPLTLDGKKTLKGYLCSDEINYNPAEGSFLPKPVPPSNPLLPFIDDCKMSPNVLKVMSGVVSKVSFHLTNFWNGNNEVEGINGSQTRRVNNDSSFIDEDLIEAKVDRILFNRLDPSLLDWLIILQDASNRLPMSRFAHQKNVTIAAQMPYFQFSTNPVHFRYDILLFKSLMQNFTLPLASLPLDERRLVTFLFQNFHVGMNRAYNTSNSEWQMKSKILEIRTKLPTSDLEEQYQISLLSSGIKSDEINDEPMDRGSQKDADAYVTVVPATPGRLRRQAGISPYQSQFSVADAIKSAEGETDLRKSPSTRSAGPAHFSLDKRTIFENKMTNIELKSLQPLPHAKDPSHSQEEGEEELLDSTELTQEVPRRANQCSKGPTTGTIWRFETFDCAFTLGPTFMTLHHVESKQFHVDFVNSFPTRTFLASSPRSNDESDEDDEDDESQFITYRDSFFAMNDLNAIWRNGVDIDCSIGPTHVNAATAGAMKFLCAFSMIRKTSDRIMARMDAIKNRFIPAEILLARPESIPAAPTAAPPSDTNGKTMIKVVDLSMIVAAQTAASKLSRAETLSAHQLQKLRPPSKEGGGSPSPYATSKGVFEEQPINKCLIVKLTNVCGEMATGLTVGRFANCEMIVNCFTQKPFLQIEDFSYEKKTLTEKKLVPDHVTKKSILKDHPVSITQRVSANEFLFHFHQLMELGEVIDELMIQESAYRVASTAPSSTLKESGSMIELLNIPRDSALSSDNSDTESEDELDFLTVGSTKSASVTSDYLGGQYAGLSSTSAGKNDHASIAVTQPALPPTVTLLEANFKKFRMKFDGPFENAFEEELFILSLEKFSISLSQDKSDDAIQDEIALLDIPYDQLDPNSFNEMLNPDTFVVYQGITGGQLKMSIDTMFMHMSVQQEPFLEAYKMSWTGLCYNASVKDDRIPLQYKLVDVVDTMVLHPFNDEADSSDNKNIAAKTIPAVQSPTDGMYVVVPKSLAPGKIYLDLSWSGETMDVNLHSFTSGCLDVVNKIFEISTPPNSDPSPMLSPWDSMRYWLHGSFAFKFQKITVVQHTLDYLHQNVRLKFSLVNPEWHIDAKSFEFTTNTLELVAEMSMTILPGRGRNTRKPKTTHTSMKMCEIPALVFSLRHRYRVSLKDGRRSRFYNHHDVYLHPAWDAESSLNGLSGGNFPQSALVGGPSQKDLASGAGAAQQPVSVRDELTKFYVNNEFVDELRYIQSDRFYYFRSNKLSINFDIELRFADRKNEPITINLRLDNLIRILDSLNNHQGSLARSNSQSPALSPEDMKLLVLKPPLIARQANSLAAGSMVNEIKVQMVMNRIIFCSWPSSKNFLGIASLQEHTDLQIRFIRQNLEKIFPTNIINNTSLDSNDSGRASITSLKYWDYYPTNKRLITFRNDFLQAIDDKAFPTQVDHLFMEISFGEIYVREWTTKNLAFNHLASTKIRSSKRNPLHASFATGSNVGTDVDQSPSNDSPDILGRDGDADEACEPKSVDDILDLFKPIHRLAHASNVIISLTESGEVSSRSNLFCFSGILTKRDEIGCDGGVSKPAKGSDPRSFKRAFGSRSGGKYQVSSDFMIGKEWRRKTIEDKCGSKSANPSDYTSQQREILKGIRRTTLERQQASSSSHLADEEASSGRPRATPRQNNKNRKSMLISPGMTTSVMNNVSAPLRTRTESSETAISQVKDSLVKRRRESVIKSDTTYRINPLGKTQKKLKWGSVTLGFKANFRNFVDNHSAFTPPSNALPDSYSKGHMIRQSSNNRFFQKGTYTDKFGYLNGLNQANEGEGTPDSSFGNKIWGLKVVDCRILFTINIRDVLFSYVGRCLDLFSSDEVENGSLDGKVVDMEGRTISQRRPSAINLGAKAAKEKATLMDFLSVDEDFSQPSPNRQRRRALNSMSDQVQSSNRNHISDPSGDNSSQNGPSKDDESEAAEITSVTAHFNLAKVESVDTSLAGELNFHEIYPDSEASVWVDDAARNTIKSRVYHTGGRGLKRADNRLSTKREFKFSMNDDEKGETGAAAPRLSIDTNWNGFHHSANSTNTNTPYSNNSAFNLKPPHFTSMKPSTAKVSTKKIPINQHFFLVELVDPQINFLDADKHGSLIIVAGRSTVEGKRLNTAILPPSNASAASEGIAGETKAAPPEPKRRQEIRLRMDGVSAFTIPTLINYNENTEGSGDSDEYEDEVFWKQLQSTSDVHTRSVYNGASVGVSNSSFLQIPPSSQGEENKDPSEVQDSPFLKTAIKDFQIRALYVFWTDVTATEAKDLYIQQSKDALTCTFRLELPELAVDIYSWQFYVILNVVRNVLLVPPPAKTSSRASGNNAETDEPESKAVEIARDADLLARFDIRANINTMLDLMKQKNCEEVRVLIEEYLSNVVENGAISRFVEIFIGRVYWKLRTNTNNLPNQGLDGNNTTTASENKGKKKKDPNDQELVEAALTGIYATMNFYEDRRVSSLFEIQRFWARNLDPGADSNAFADKTSIVIPILEQKDICTRCGTAFTAEENNSTACSFHGGDDGTPGEFKEKVTIDEITGKEQRYKAWTCCGRTHEFAPGCSKGPHDCKEVMISIRAEAHAPLRIENVDITVIKQLEISIFPCANYFLRLQITKSLADLLHKYFSIDNVEAYEAASAQYNNTNNSETNSDTSSNTNSQSSNKKSKKIIPKVFKLKNRNKKRENSDASSLDSDTRTRAMSSGMALTSTNGVSGETSEEKPSSRRANRSVTTGSAVDISHGKKHAVTKRQEGLYILYLRVGDINVDVSTAGFGFALNLDRFQAVMDKFFCKKQLLDWKRLIWQLEKHLVTSLIKHTASNSFSKLFSLGRRQSNALGNNAFLTNSRASIVASTYPSHQGNATSRHPTSGGPAMSETELLLNAKKNMLLGGNVKSRTSSISLLPKRPTLYSSPTAGDYLPRMENSGEEERTHLEEKRENDQKDAKLNSTPSSSRHEANISTLYPLSGETPVDDEKGSGASSAHSFFHLLSSTSPAPSLKSANSDAAVERQINPLNIPKKEKSKFLGLF